MLGGFIQFVGGPWHGTIKRIPEWHPVIEIMAPVEPPKLHLSALDEIEPAPLEVLQYELKKTASGVYHYVYK